MLCRHPLAAIACAAATAAAQADPGVNFVQDLSAPRPPLSSVDLQGTVDLLAGGRAVALFHDGSTETAGFVVSGSGLSQTASAETAAFLVVAWSDAATDDSQPEEWQVHNLDPTRTLVGFSIDLAGEGMAGAFDTSLGATFQDVGTPGSAAGRSLTMDFRDRGFITGSYTVTHSQPLALQGAGPVGDLFGRVDVRLNYANTGLNGGLPPNRSSLSSQRFYADLDRVVYAPVPEPGTAALLLGGAALLCARRRTATAHAQAWLSPPAPGPTRP